MTWLYFRHGNSINGIMFHILMNIHHNIHTTFCSLLLIKDETDEYYASIILYKTQKAYSPRTSHNQKRLIRKAALSYEMENGVLYRPSKEGRKQVATCHLDRLSLLQKAHVDAEGKCSYAVAVWKHLHQSRCLIYFSGSEI